jgi:predicted extracellular nuclease
MMGDFNDYPMNKSMKRLCSGKHLHNLMKDKKGGTYRYRGEWGILDQFIVSGSLLKKKSNIRTSKAKAQVLRHAFLLEEDDRYGGDKPFRTYNGMKYQGGFSDHLPISLDLTISD